VRDETSIPETCAASITRLPIRLCRTDGQGTLDQTATPSNRRRGDVMPLKLCGVLAVLSAFTGGMAADDKKADPIDAKKLVGKWEAKGLGDGESLVLEFKNDGKMALTAAKGEEQERGDGTYTLDGNKLTVNLTLKGEKDTNVVTISKLTDAELLWTTKSGKERVFVRVKDKK
jgi:uncharacterized protein (TIGR03066 family)